MNVYFLVEGKRTEKKVYPKWLSFLVPELTRVLSHDKVNIDNYYIFSGNGFPSLLDVHLRNCIEDVNTVGTYDYFVICLDSDEKSIDDCKRNILQFMEEEKISLNEGIRFEIIVQNKCIETWFLGNPKIYKRNPSDKTLRDYVAFYNTKEKDLELMPKLPNFEGSLSIFHSAYLRSLLAERKVAYSKEYPNEVVEEYFLNELIKRNEQTAHIPSFKYFIDFCMELKKLIEDNKK